MSNWQVRQVRDALRLYLSRYKDEIRFRKLLFRHAEEVVLSSEQGALVEVKHNPIGYYSYRTEQKYVD